MGINKPPKEIYRYIVDDKVIHDDKEPRTPLYNKYIREDIVRRMRLSAYAGAYARIMSDFNKEK